MTIISSYTDMLNSGGGSIFGKTCIGYERDYGKTWSYRGWDCKLLEQRKLKWVKEAQRLLDDKYEYLKMNRAYNPYGDGIS